jgi:hypothetical protein
VRGRALEASYNPGKLTKPANKGGLSKQDFPFHKTLRLDRLVLALVQIKLLLEIEESILGVAHGGRRNFELLGASRTPSDPGRAGNPLDYSETAPWHCPPPGKSGSHGCGALFDTVHSVRAPRYVSPTKHG